MTAGEILHQLENQHVLVIGDVMVDRYLTGTVSRISPEAPVPVVLHQRTDDRLGPTARRRSGPGPGCQKLDPARI